LTIAYRQLAENAEKNSRFEEASKFRHAAFALERLSRKEHRHTQARKVQEILSSEYRCFEVVPTFLGKIAPVITALAKMQFDPISFLYRWSSGYGERWYAPLGWLVIVCISFSLFYSNFGSFTMSLKSLNEWIGYSAMVMAFQRPDPRPANLLTSVMYVGQMVLSAILVALLVLAVRRKFIR
jgi:hypothetical protein